jgi:hypothetical protein
MSFRVNYHFLWGNIANAHLFWVTTCWVVLLPVYTLAALETSNASTTFFPMWVLDGVCLSLLMTFKSWLDPSNAYSTIVSTFPSLLTISLQVVVVLVVWVDLNFPSSICSLVYKDEVNPTAYLHNIPHSKLPNCSLDSNQINNISSTNFI